MINYKLSVVVINYNKEKFIEESLQSVIDQSLENIELIVVDDGSTDKSSVLAEEFTNKYQNAKFIKQENKGPSAARNTGLSHASGEYIAFLDGDDIAYPDAYGQLYSLAKKYNADTAVGNILCFNGEKTWRLNYMKEIFKEGLPENRQILKNPELHLTPSASNKLFKKELLEREGIRFHDELRVGEDLFFTEKSLLKSNCTVVCDVDVIGYRIEDPENSLIKSGTIQFFKQLVVLQKELRAYYEDNGFTKELIHIERRQLKFFINSINLKANKLPDDEKLNLAYVGNEFMKTIRNESIKDELSVVPKFVAETLRLNDKRGLKIYLSLKSNPKMTNSKLRKVVYLLSLFSLRYKFVKS
ncbi:glycosyltransferase family 2 protein [Bacillus sp. UNCCL81]|uniref:glycosyltransferase family 2 protein n=1 Tax=Bacillus sp. UNCCL81 TaxID=1502755 RepID=UPI0008ECDAC7|nr:glycosyltransferase family 2 protein [Bacillus sp. UNCCL81]SFD10636.1 Glycosyltransferase involved in cell wall bisynthesis [Bacillus sp. UNCCL81]